MKVRYITIASEESQEAKEKLQKVEEYCRQLGGMEVSSLQTVNGKDYIQVAFEDKFYSEEMKRLIEECQENEWPEGEKICKNSRNILEAYLKAKEAFKERNEALEGQQISEPKSPAYVALLQAGSFKNFLARRIVRKVMQEYSQKGEKHASREKWR